jgi:membrane protease YdiL (CAAX protease family)
MDDKRKALLGLILVGLAPTASILSSFGTGDGLLGQIAWFCSKLWMLGLPLLWRIKIDKKPISWSKPENGGFTIAIILGIAIAVVIVIAWWLFGAPNVDRNEVINALEPFGLTVWTTYLAGAIFWTFGNSVLEEYVFRWFIVEKAEHVVNGLWYTVLLSAGIFVIHHAFALYFLGFPLWMNAIACLGLFIGGSIFSWLYIKYRSIWIPYITHVLCDIAVFGIGAIIIFG